MEYDVIIPAAGSGTRMGAGKNKLLLELNERPIILHTLEVFAGEPDCSKMIVVIQPKEEKIFREMTVGSPYEKNWRLCMVGQSGSIAFIMV